MFFKDNVLSRLIKKTVENYINFSLKISIKNFSKRYNSKSYFYLFIYLYCLFNISNF